MKHEDLISAIADAVLESKKEGDSITIEHDGKTYNVNYTVIELENEEPACYDANSCRCSPGGSYGTDIYAFEYLNVTDEDENEIDIDLEELSQEYNLDDKKSLSNYAYDRIKFYYENEYSPF